MKNKRLIIILISIVVILLIPFIAMQFSNEINWELNDFVIMGAMLLSTGLSCELVLRKAKSVKTRILICALILLVFLLVWAELAVGILGTPFAGS
jgi:uncharacterized protein YybS (DUF2232 family)